MAEAHSSEKGRLGKIASDSWYARGVNEAMIKYSFEVFQRYIRGETTLEVGPAEGVMTRFLEQLPQALAIVEGAKIFADKIAKAHSSIKVYNCLIEEFKSS